MNGTGVAPNFTCAKCGGAHCECSFTDWLESAPSPALTDAGEPLGAEPHRSAPPSPTPDTPVIE